jgi:hypothetical protein
MTRQPRSKKRNSNSTTTMVAADTARRYSDAPIITDENLVNFSRSLEELQLFWLYCGFSVMRSRKPAQTALTRLLDDGIGDLPFDRLSQLANTGKLRKSLESTRIGGWDRLEGFVRHTAEGGLDLEHGKVEDFEAIHGIGLAKARFFLLCTRENARVAVLDRHILQFLRDQGYPEVPESTPKSRKVYTSLEGYFLQEAERSGIQPAQFNLEQWRRRATRAIQD